MADKFRKGDVVTYMSGDLGAFDATVTQRRADVDAARGTEAYNVDLPNDRGQGLMYSDEMTLVKRIRFEEGDRVVANETISNGSHKVQPGARGTILEATEIRAPEETQFLRIQWNDGALSGVYSSRVDYLKSAVAPIITCLPNDLKPALTYEALKEGGKIFFSDVKDPEHITVAELGKMQDISDYTTSFSFSIANADGTVTEAEDLVNHPSHYTGFSNGAEVIDITENLNFNRGNAVKYLARAGAKDPETEMQDLLKAQFYVNREVNRLDAVIADEEAEE